MTDDVFYQEFLRQGGAGEPLDDLVFQWVRDALRPAAERRADRDEFLREAAALLPEDGPWAKAGRLAALAREVRRRPPEGAPDLSTAAGCVAAALLAYPGRGVSARQIYRVIAAIGPVEMSAGGAASSSRTKGEHMHYGRFTAGLDSRDKFVRQGTAAIVTRAGHAATIVAGRRNEHLADHLRNVDLDPGEYNDATLFDLARSSLERHGLSTRGMDRYDLVRRALEYRSGAQVASDFTVLLENAIGKLFLGRYAVTPTTWPRWCGRRAVRDFKQTAFFRGGSFGALDAVPEGGEIASKMIPDAEKNSITAGTKGNIIEVSDRAIANDDMSAFEDLAAAAGEAAAFTVERDVYALLTANGGLGATMTDGNPLFDASRSNIGPTGAMTATTLDGARAAMAKQTAPGGNRGVGFRPTVWLGPAELAGQARALNDAQYAPGASQATSVRGLFNEVIDSDFLSAASATRHYLLADPSAYPAIAVAFLEGRETPRIESRLLFRSSLLSVRVLLDYGVGVLDHRPAVTCAGE